jgi:ribosomal protein S18 acetylase RimI-like enzyme
MMNEEVIAIREAAPQDAAGIARVHVASWRAAYQGIVPDSVLASLDVDARTRSWEEILSKVDLPCFLLIAEEEINGFAALCRSRDPDRDPSEIAEIASIYLDPRYYRQGYGSLLMQHAMETVTSLGFAKVDIWVLERNLAARRFYEKAGFAEDGPVKVLERLGQSEIRYSRTL